MGPYGEREKSVSPVGFEPTTSGTDRRCSTNCATNHSQPDKNRSKADGIQFDPAQNGKISMRSLLSNAIRVFRH